jgi:hypothetical protein
VVRFGVRGHVMIFAYREALWLGAREILPIA